ncbi:MAG TPA: MFS transporter [Gaiellaceae bacterium]|nr:MFS transporter [Gaiellaceae bacterium]
MGAAAQRMREAGEAFRGVFRNPDLRRLQLAAAASLTGQNAYTVALAVYAYREGGATAVGVITLIRMAPAALFAPFVAILADRFSRRRVLLASDVVRALLMGAAAFAALAGWPYGVVFAIAGISRTVGTSFRPAQSALLPKLARTPEELTAANVVASTIESVGIFAGPALGGLLLALFSPGATFALTGVTYVWSALLIARIGPDEAPAGSRVAGAGAWTTASAGFRTIGGEPKVRLIVLLYSAQTVVAGAVSVLVVVAALDLLDLGDAGVGFLNSAAGIGGVVGAAVVLALSARGRLAGDFGLGVALFGLPLVLLGAWPSPAVALVALGVLGLGNTVTDVNALTLLQRNAPDEVLGRVFGVLQSALVATMGLGAMLAPLLISLAGIRTALVAFGLLLPVLSAALWLQLQRLDREAQVPVRQLELLRAIPIFAPLPPATLEALAHALQPLTVVGGTDVVRAGEAGDRFYLIDEGEAEALVDGGARRLGPGEGFGEIALLRDVPRTATVRAATDLRLYALERGEFLAAVTGHAPSRAAAEVVVAERLGAIRPGAVSI